MKSLIDTGFMTHTKEIITGDRLKDALNKVADDMIENAHKVRGEKYADHVTEQDKDRYLADNLMNAERVREGNYHSFAVWQKINMVLTGECVALLS